MAETVEDIGAELMDVEGGRIDERIGQVANGVEQLAFFDDGAGNCFGPAQRVGTPRLGVAAHQHGILRIEKDNAGRNDFADVDEDFRQAVERDALAHVDHDGGLGNVF